MSKLTTALEVEFNEIKRVSEVINDHFWYVDPKNITASYSRILSAVEEMIAEQKHWIFRSQHGLEKINDKIVAREIKDEEYIRLSDLTSALQEARSNIK